MNSKNQGVRHAILAVVLIALNLTNTMAQQEIGYIEEFALAADRTEALEQLIPGTEDYYYFHALHYQNTGHRAELNDMLGQLEPRKDMPPFQGRNTLARVLYRLNKIPHRAVDPGEEKLRHHLRGEV